MDKFKTWNDAHYDLFINRKKKLESDGIRSPFERDIHRIMYSDAFRRLRHKTQVFFLPNNDHICTRIEHVLHVSEASLTVARQLNLNQDLTRAIAIGHDLGHAPLGHWGETVLSTLAEKYSINSNLFNHEVHGLRVVDKLAQLDREDGPGLNLTYAVRDGIISHCGEDVTNKNDPSNPEGKDLESINNKKNAGLPISYEGCIVRIADKIVYAGRDLEDALKARIIQEDEIDSELKDILSVLGKNNGEIVGVLITDLINNGKDGYIRLSENYDEALKGLIKWNYNKIYTNENVDKYKEHARRGITKLFEQLVEDIRITNRFSEKMNKLPQAKVYCVFKEFLDYVRYREETKNEQIVLDFIAGMTDNYLINCISEIFSPKPIT